MKNVVNGHEVTISNSDSQPRRIVHGYSFSTSESEGMDLCVDAIQRIQRV